MLLHQALHDSIVGWLSIALPIGRVELIATLALSAGGFPWQDALKLMPDRRASRDRSDYCRTQQLDRGRELAVSYGILTLSHAKESTVGNFPIEPDQGLEYAVS